MSTKPANKLSVSAVITSISRATKRDDCRILNFNEFKAAVAVYWLFAKGVPATHEEIMSVYQTGKQKGLWSCSKFDKESGEEPVLFINVESEKPSVSPVALGVEV